MLQAADAAENRVYTHAENLDRPRRTCRVRRGSDGGGRGARNCRSGGAADRLQRRTDARLARFGAVCVGLWAPRGGWLAQAAGVAFVVGLILFCSAVYALGLAGTSLGMVAPAGGILLMLGWLCLAASALRGR